jgi:uncharacterized cupin superfamily protein
MPKIDTNRVAAVYGSSYPSPFDEPCRDRTTRALGDAIGLKQVGVNHVTLAPGAWSSQRHWHEREDEIVVVLAGELVLIEDDGEILLRTGDCAGWAAGTRNGHHLVNRSRTDATFLVVGTRDDADRGEYSDIDMTFGPGRYSGDKTSVFRQKDGTPY